MTLRNWIELGIIAATMITGIVLFLRYRKKVAALDGFEGMIEEFGELERLDGPDWQMEAFKELAKKQSKRKSKNKNQ